MTTLSAACVACRVDPTFRIDELLANVYVSGGLDRVYDATGPIRPTFIAPNGSAVGLPADAGGFRQGYDIRTASEDRLRGPPPRTASEDRLRNDASRVGLEIEVVVPGASGGPEGDDLVSSPSERWHHDHRPATAEAEVRAGLAVTRALDPGPSNMAPSPWMVSPPPISEVDRRVSDATACLRRHRAWGTLRPKNQEPRTKNQEPRTKNQEPRTKNQEPRTKNQEPDTVPPMQHVAIVGSGVIGLSTAFALRQRGVPRVTVVEGGPGPSGASLVNAGWVCPGHADPVPAPGLVGRSARWMLRSDSPLYIRPTLDPGFLRWLVAFWRNCTARRYDAGLAAMAALNAGTPRLFDAYAAAGVRFDEAREGLLLAFLGMRRMEAELRHLEHHPGLFGLAPRSLEGGAARELEPGLSDAVNGVIVLANERHVVPSTLMAGLAAWLDERGVELRMDSPVSGIETDGRRARLHLEGDAKGETLEADAVVIAAGARTGALTRMLGVAMPIQAGKGYSLDYAAPPGPVGRPISLAEASMAVTPMGGGVRLAGTMELSGINTVVRPERVAALARGAGVFLRGWPGTVDGAVVGSGLRPMTPDGLPVIGMLPGLANVAISTGHGMLGLTMAPASAEALADTLLTGRAPDVLAPFRPERFARGYTDTPLLV